MIDTMEPYELPLGIDPTVRRYRQGKEIELAIGLDMSKEGHRYALFALWGEVVMGDRPLKYGDCNWFIYHAWLEPRFVDLTDGKVLCCVMGVGKLLRVQKDG